MQDLDNLTQAIAWGEQDFVNTEEFRQALGLDDDWDWETIQSMIESGAITLEEVETAVHNTVR